MEREKSHYVSSTERHRSSLRRRQAVDCIIIIIVVSDNDILFMWGKKSVRRDVFHL